MLNQAKTTVKSFTLPAGATAVNYGRFVKLSGTSGRNVVLATDAIDTIGLAIFPLANEQAVQYTGPNTTIPVPTAKALETIDVALFGSGSFELVELGATLTAGALVKSGADGRAIAAGTVAVNEVVFRILEGGTAGRLVPCLLSGTVKV